VLPERPIRTVHELLKLAQGNYAQATIALNPEAKSNLVQVGHQYLKEGDDMPRNWK